GRHQRRDLEVTITVSFSDFLVVGSRTRPLHPGQELSRYSAERVALVKGHPFSRRACESLRTLRRVLLRPITDHAEAKETHAQESQRGGLWDRRRREVQLS